MNVTDVLLYSILEVSEATREHIVWLCPVGCKNLCDGCVNHRDMFVITNLCV